MTNEVHFVSSFKWYDLEASGIKPYTIRDDTEKNRKKIEGKECITIHRAYTKTKFTKRITLIVKWKGNIILSWNPHNKNEVDKHG